MGPALRARTEVDAMRASRAFCLLLAALLGAWGSTLACAAPDLMIAAASSPGVDAAAGKATTGTDSLRFAPGSVALPADAPALLDKLASRLAADGKRRVELLAYSTGNEASEARRLSLDRAIAVRAYLAARGVSPARVILRPLGGRGPEGIPADRVDMVALD
jgi:outer membrane protein OmpA-like peptidoglycan-associated protein